MLCYSPLPIGAPLTMMPPGQEGADDEDAAAQELAVQMFRHVLGIMGAREYPYPDALPDTIVEQCQALLHEREPGHSMGVALLDELYVQLMKQLDGGAPVAQEGRAWQFFAFILERQPPSERLENHVEFFLRRAGRGDLVLQLHISNVRGRALLL